MGVLQVKPFKSVEAIRGYTSTLEFIPIKPSVAMA
jgi:hypothetical protein